MRWDREGELAASEGSWPGWNGMEKLTCARTRLVNGEQRRREEDNTNDDNNKWTGTTLKMKFWWIPGPGGCEFRRQLLL